MAALSTMQQGDTDEDSECDDSAYGSQIERKMRLGINHITEEESLPAFFAAHQQAMTTETITSGFKATGLVPLNPERVLAELGPTIEATPSPRGSIAADARPQSLHTISNLCPAPKMLFEDLYTSPSLVNSGHHAVSADESRLLFGPSLLCPLIVSPGRSIVVY